MTYRTLTPEFSQWIVAFQVETWNSFELKKIVKVQLQK